MTIPPFDHTLYETKLRRDMAAEIRNMQTLIATMVGLTLSTLACMVANEDMAVIVSLVFVFVTFAFGIWYRWYQIVRRSRVVANWRREVERWLAKHEA